MAELRRHHRRARGDPRPTAPSSRAVIKDELGEIKEKFANPRRSQITYDVGDIDIEDLIDDEDLVVTMSAKGYIKTVASDAFRTQGRGGRGVAGGQAQGRGLRQRTSSTPRPTPTCCSSRTSGGSTGSRPTRSR